MNYFINFAITILFIFSNISFANDNKIIFEINNKIYSEVDFEYRINYLEKINGINYSPKFEKDLKKLSAEAAFFDNTLYTKDDIAKVATLPSLDEIRGKIVGLINAPASKLVRLLQRPDQDIISILQNKKD